MLQIEIGGAWQRLEPERVVDRMLAGDLHGRELARDPSMSEATEALQQVLGPDHFRVLSQRILDEVRRIYRGEPQAAGLAELEERITRLAQWELSPGYSGAMQVRLTWLSAWLAELLDRRLVAIRRYGQVLGHPSRDEPGLRLLALNNRAVLMLQMGDLSAFRDLVMAAIRHRLPGACFNLLNIINFTLENESFPAIAEELHSVLVELPEKDRVRWVPRAASRKAREPVLAGQHAAAGADLTPEDAAGLALDSDARQLRLFLRELAKEARGVAPAPGIESELHFWLVPGSSSGEGQAFTSRHARYSEAVTLLYADQLPTDFSGYRAQSNWDEAAVERLLLRAREQLSNEQFVAARATAGDAATLSSALGTPARPSPRAKRLQKECQELLKHIEVRRRQRRELELQSEMTTLTREVDRLCETADLARLVLERALLSGRFARVRQLEESVWPDLKLDCTHSLVLRLNECAGKLAEQRRDANLSVPYQRLLQLLPTSLAVPVPPKAVEAVRLCRSADPHGEVQKWDDVLEAFHRHDAVHHFHRAFLLACGSDSPHDAETRQQIEQSIQMALLYDRQFAVHAAPILRLVCASDQSRKAESLDELRTSLLEAARQLMAEPLLGRSTLIPSKLRDEFRRDAAGYLRQAILAFPRRDGDREVIEHLFQQLDKTYGPILHDGAREEIADVVQVLEQFAGAWPESFDARFPAHRLIQRAKQAERLAAAREWLQAAHEFSGKLASSEAAGARNAAVAILESAFGEGWTEAEQPARATQYLAQAKPPERLLTSALPRFLDLLEARTRLEVKPQQEQCESANAPILVIWSLQDARRAMEELLRDHPDFVAPPKADEGAPLSE